MNSIEDGEGQMALMILEPGEEAELARCEGVIARGLQTFVEVGLALATVREARLYRAQFATFEDYCRERWGMAARTAHQTIRSAGAVTMLGDCEVLPERESVARVLALLAPNDAKRIWLEAIANDVRITAAALKRMIARISHDHQGLGRIVDVTCPQCAHVFRPWRPENASRGKRNPSRGVQWAISILPPELRTACDYGCGRFRNAALLEARFEWVTFVDTAAQCARLEALRGKRDVRAVGTSLPSVDVVFLICVLHILADDGARRRAAAEVEKIGAPWLVIETPRFQSYYRHAAHTMTREGSHYWNLTDAQLDELFPGYRVTHRKTAKHNAISIFARN